MLVFIGTIGRSGLSDTGFDARARAAIAQCGIEHVDRMLLGNGTLYYGCANAPGPGDDRIVMLGKNQGLLAGKMLSSDDYLPMQFEGELVDALVADPQVSTTRFWGRYSGCLYNRRSKVGTQTIVGYALFC